MNRIFALLTTVFCVAANSYASGDGEIPLPINYKDQWPTFIVNIQRPDIKQVRDIYMNNIATHGSRRTGFPDKSEFVMENYSVKTSADGMPVKNGNGDMVKDKLLSVFVMQKEKAFGASAPEGLNNGDWAYASYAPNGTSNGKDMTACRACHLPLSEKDFVQRYDEFFNKKM